MTRADANAFVAALNARALCACATLRTLGQLGVQGPYLPCQVHHHDAGALCDRRAAAARATYRTGR